jgi:hypothetical protein
MKYAVKPLLAILGAVGLCSCASLPFSDPFDRGENLPSRNQALDRAQAYMGWRSEIGHDGANIEKMNALYSSNW